MTTLDRTFTAPCKRAPTRATIEQQRAAGRLQSNHVEPTDDVERRLVQSYVEAFQARDLKKFAHMLTQDVVLTMPPLPLRYAGREAVTAFYAAVAYASPDEFAFLSTRANRHPAVGVYRLDADIYLSAGGYLGAACGRRCDCRDHRVRRSHLTAAVRFAD